MWRDLERQCAGLAIPFKRPSRFPRNGLMAARIASVAAGEGWCPAFTRAVFRANFAEDREIGEAGTLREILESLGRGVLRDPLCWRSTRHARQDGSC